MSKFLIAADTDVRNTQKFYDELDRLMGASIGVIAIRTREMNRGRLLLHQWASTRDMDFYVWDILAGFKAYRKLPVVDEGDVADDNIDMGEYLNPTSVIENTNNPLTGMDHYTKRETSKETNKNMFCGVFMGVVDDWLKEPMIQQHIRDHVQRAYQCNDRMILMLSPGTALPDAIVGDVEVVDLPTPSFAELRDVFQEMQDDIADLGYTPEEEECDVIVQNGIGMTQQEFENAVSLAIVDASAMIEAADEDAKPEIDIDHFVKTVRERKLTILKQTKILELMPPAAMSDVGGLDLLKEELDLQRDAFDKEAQDYGINPPKGFLVVGPPGSGKSLVCKATSAMLGLPAIKFDLSAVYNSLVGSSEQRMRACLEMINDMAPCLVFLDEIDKAIGTGGQGSNDSGVSSRIFGTLLSWMQDKQDKGIPVLVVASANNVEQIPPELLRKGRFDDIWSVTFPTEEERATIFRIHVEKRGHQLTDEDYKKLAKHSNRFVGAEIEAVVEAALRVDYRAKRPGVTVATLLNRLANTIPQAKAFPERIAAMAAWAEKNARPASSKPEEPDDAVEPKLAGGRSRPIRRPLRPSRAGKN